MDVMPHCGILDLQAKGGFRSFPLPHTITLVIYNNKITKQEVYLQQ